jgi:hypothetical protein
MRRIVPMSNKSQNWIAVRSVFIDPEVLDVAMLDDPLARRDSEFDDERVHRAAGAELPR